MKESLGNLFEIVLNNTFEIMKNFIWFLDFFFHFDNLLFIYFFS